MERILQNIAIDYPKSSYCQGFNYIAVFLFYLFDENELKTYRFMAFITETYLRHKVDKELKGVMELIFLNDKMLQIFSPKIWGKLQQGTISSIHFTISTFITGFTSLIKDPSKLPLVEKIWDLFIADGYVSLLRTQYLIISSQEEEIMEVGADVLLTAIKEYERNPLSIVNFLKKGQERVDEINEGLTKANINRVQFGKDMYQRLTKHYWMIHQPILEFWNEH